MLVHQLMYRGAAEQVALYGGQQEITYGQLQKQVILYRDFFYQQGVRPGENVGLFAKNSIEFIYSYLAITSLGAVVVPLNFQLVAREIAFIVQNSQMKTLITMGHLELTEELRSYGYDQELKQLVIPEFASMLTEMDIPEAAVPIASDPHVVCTIIYTSGTTGNPKGAMLTHRNLVSNAQAVTERLAITAEDHVLCVLPMYHAFAWTCAVLVPLFNGASITVVETFAREVVSVIRDTGINVVFAIPTMFKLFAVWGNAIDFQKVRLYVSGGSSLLQEVYQQFSRKSGRPIVEGYGLSEASPVVTISSPNRIKMGSIGSALPGLDVCIMGDDGQVLDTGEIGELVVKGPSVMVGYLNRPEETAQALQDGWLHTGDLAYRDADGDFYLVDRLKDMIITSGENVYPREIEELLVAFPNVMEASVVGVPDKLRGNAGCAYIVMAEGHELDKKALKEYLQANLAIYKIPREFVQVNSLPKNSTGKILKRLLREKAESAHEQVG
ncbi:MAG: o-succinylbenzoate--CoA ligase [Firmicutes bacterium]|nr:o-succinylbenzoate--CoA ligase [Bacillota bacterium]